MRYVSLWCCVAMTASGVVRDGRFLGRPAWIVETSTLRVTVLQGGGHVAEIVLTEGPGVNPLWIQSRPTVDPDQYDPARHEKVYGPGSGARLMSGLAGHNLCFPFWGDPSPAETRAGMTYHGETGVVRWSRLDAAGEGLRIAAELPESRTRFVRSIEVSGQVVRFDSTAENQSAWDRPVGWCEHVTLGPPFLEKGVTRIDASLTRGRKEAVEFRWPEGMADTRVDLRTANTARAGFVNNFQVDPARRYGWFVASRGALLFGYVFLRQEFPWLNIWESNTPQMLTRGMEFSNTPTHGTMRRLVAVPELWGTPAYEWLEARGTLRKRFAAFSARAPEGWRGAVDVRVQDGALEIVEEGTGRVVRLAFRGF